jgi:membrane protease YdiL (CAAX protease family)
MGVAGRLRDLLAIGPVDWTRTSLFELRRIGPFPAWAQIAAVAACFAAAALLSNAEYREHGTSFGFAGTGTNATINPIYEELIFRGWILGALARARSAVLAIAVSSLLFGLLHLRNVYWLEPRALANMMLWAGLAIGPVLGWVTLKCRSVWPAVLLHYGNNLAYYL